MNGLDTDGNKNLLWIYLAELAIDLPKQVRTTCFQMIRGSKALLAVAMPEDENAPGWPAGRSSPIIYSVTLYFELFSLDINSPGPVSDLHLTFSRLQ
jgi:hypothetical protein